MSEDLILLSLLDPDVDSTTKRAIVKPARMKYVQMSFILVTFVSMAHRNVFAKLGMTHRFLDKDSDTWKDGDDFKAVSDCWVLL